jgi:hypothetical protein
MYLTKDCFKKTISCILLKIVLRKQCHAGADPGFQVRGGAHLKKLRRAEGGAKIFGVLCFLKAIFSKLHDFVFLKQSLVRYMTLFS